MKLCERCASNAYGIWNHYNLGQREIVIVKDAEPPGDLEIVPETKCEFWAHKRLNEFYKFYGNDDPIDTERRRIFGWSSVG